MRFELVLNFNNTDHEQTLENVTKKVFNDYIKSLIEFLKKEHPDEKFVFIMDNAIVHQKEEVTAICTAENIRCLFLAPYSPYLNPIERCFSQIKSHVKEWLARNNDRLIATCNLPWGQKGAARSQILD